MSGDFHGDGREELLVRHDVIAGWSWGWLRPFGLEGIGETLSAGAPDQNVSILQRAGLDAESIFAASRGYLENPTGKARYLVGCPAFEYRLFRWRSGGFEEVGRVYAR